MQTTVTYDYETGDTTITVTDDTGTVWRLVWDEETAGDPTPMEAFRNGVTVNPFTDIPVGVLEAAHVAEEGQV